jgi:hypothetical protein
MRKSTAATVTGLGIFLLVLATSADTLIFRDGGRISGRLVGVAARIITVGDASGVTHRHPADEVAALELAQGRGGNADTGTLDGARPIGAQGARGDKTIVQSMTDSLRLYAMVANVRK